MPEDHVEEIEVADPLDDFNLLDRLLTTEPALIRGFASAALLVAVAYGAPISEDQRTQTLLFVGALLALAQAIWTRSVVDSPATRLRREALNDAMIEHAYNAGAEDAERGIVAAGSLN